MPKGASDLPSLTSQAVPDQGQIVQVRRRHFVVVDVLGSATANGTGGQHLVTLSAIDDDGLGDELRVIWELEPGVEIRDRLNLPAPDGFDSPARLDAFLDAVRWGDVSSADVQTLQSPFRSGIQIEDYQLDPVVRALRMPRVNLLIADDVGLGKTIESGLVVQEMILRHRVRTVLVVCPASLQIQWRDQMRDKFGLEFRIVDSELMRELRRTRGLHDNPWSHFPRLITSVDFLKRDRPMRLFRDLLPPPGQPPFPRRFDLLIVDEAHNVAPSGTGRYAVDSLRTSAIRALAPHFEHRLFLTATPHNGYLESFTALLELLDNQRFARGIQPDRVQLGAVMVRRLKTEMIDFDGQPLFPRRLIEPLEVAYTEAERLAHRHLAAYAKARENRATDPVEKCATEFVLKLLKKRLFSSPAAFASTLQQHETSLASARTHRAASRPSVGILQRRLDAAEEDYADDDAYEESSAEVVDDATRLFSDPSVEEKQHLEHLRTWAAGAAQCADSKAERLIAWLQEMLRPGGHWNDERALIFTEYRATQKWLQGLLAASGLGGSRLLVLYGGMVSEDRERIKAAFQADPKVSPVRILLATDAASEGIDLQNHCHRLIHYEIPWNPNRMEQRNGRLDRHGQKAKAVLVHHFVGAGFRKDDSYVGRPPGSLEGDLEFLMRAAQKVEQMREDLGKVAPVIAAQVEEAMLGRRSRLDAREADQGPGSPRAILKFERKLREEIEKLHNQLQQTRQDLRLSPRNIQAVVEVGIQLAGQPPLQPARLDRIPANADGPRVFHLPAFRGSWASCSEGLRHPHTGDIRPVVFEHSLAEGTDDVVLLHLNHRLVQMCLRLLRAEIWSPASQSRLHRVAARVVPDLYLDSPAVVAYGRLLILGADNHRLHEEIVMAGGRLHEGRFVRMKPEEVEKAVKAAGTEEAPPGFEERLAAAWDQCRAPLLSALDACARQRGADLARTLSKRAEKEAADITAILRELQSCIRSEIHAPAPLQLSLFSDLEQKQLDRNRDFLSRRLDELPAEIERETGAIRARYADPSSRLFPVAVVFLAPARYAREHR